MKAAAAWVHGRRVITQLRLDPNRSVPAELLYEPCPECEGQPGDSDCPDCEGMGYVDRDPGDDTPPAEWAEDLDEFMRAVASIDRHGVQGWLLLEGSGNPPHPAFVQALELFDGELNRLDVEHQIDEAERSRRKGQ